MHEWLSSEEGTNALLPWPLEQESWYWYPVVIPWYPRESSCEFFMLQTCFINRADADVIPKPFTGQGTAVSSYVSQLQLCFVAICALVPTWR